MSLNNKKPIPDLINIEHNDIAEARNSLAYGKTTGGDYVPILVGDSGDLGYLKLDGSNANQNINIGTYTLTLGKVISGAGATAAGVNANALGGGVTASGLDSLATGYSTTASANY